jgi:hypothetical protein
LFPSPPADMERSHHKEFISYEPTGRRIDSTSRASRSSLYSKV